MGDFDEMSKTEKCETFLPSEKEKGLRAESAILIPIDF